MKIYIIDFNNYGYDQYDAFIVASKDEQSAIEFLKSKYPENDVLENVNWGGGYTVKEVVTEEYETDTEILSSYNAG